MRDTIIIAVISAMTSGGFLAFLQFLITRNDDKQGIKKSLKKLEKDGLRTQLLLILCILMVLSSHIMMSSRKKALEAY